MVRALARAVAAAAALAALGSTPAYAGPDPVKQPIDDGCQRNPAGLLTFSSPEWVRVGGDSAQDARRSVEGTTTLSHTADEDLLKRLAKEGVLLGITSGAVEAAAHIKLSRAGFNRYFPFGGYGSDSGDRTELTKCALARGERLLGEPLEPEGVYVVGDTPKDLDAAHGAGCVAVGVATGHYSREQLEEAGADVVLDSLRDPFPGFD